MQIENFNDLIAKTNISGFVTTTDIVKGKQYDKEKISFIEKKESKGTYEDLTVFHFEVDSETKPTYYDVKIVLENNKNILKCTCDCKAYRNFQSCKHIGAVFVNFYEFIFKKSIVNIHKISDNILKKFLTEEKSLIKKELNVELIINVTEKENYYYYGNYTDFNIKIMLGENKLYTLGNHVSAFKSAYA